MEFGVFLPNGANGYILSTRSPRYFPTFKHNLAITLEAERVGMDFVLSMMKYRGFGGASGYWDACLESFNLMAGLAAATETIGLFPSVTLLAHHPAVVARIIATIDDISRGRCGLNIVTGWNRPEYAQMGLWPGAEYYESRYDYAAEYIQILKALWRDCRATFHGRFFNIDDCSCLPTPTREIPIVSAGQSPRGQHFTATYCDRNFVISNKANLRKISDAVKAKAAAAGRSAGTYALHAVIAAPTDREAREIADEIVSGADIEAIRNVLASAELDTNTGGQATHLQAALDARLEDGNMIFMGFPVICGSYETVSREIDEIALASGVDGILLSFPDFVPDLRAFGEHVMPQLSCRANPAIRERSV